ncbi:MAG: DUF192 domain-containing protein [Dehalococcoidia bacterium]|jgi:uncharacterized membrane protein (UPF0127 family)|nr:DUF192 domain-containing protein [Dehalococcoidia bacterium]
MVDSLTQDWTPTPANRTRLSYSTPSTVRDVHTQMLLATQLKHASNPWTRFQRLMLRSPLAAQSGLVVARARWAHTLFMRSRIDVVFYDDWRRVTHVSHGVLPWLGLVWGGREARGLLQLPAGAAQDVQVGHTLEFLP